MRITSKIPADGNRWAVKFPTVDATKCFPFLGGKQTAQPDECLAELQSQSPRRTSRGASHSTYSSTTFCEELTKTVVPM